VPFDPARRGSSSRPVQDPRLRGRRPLPAGPGGPRRHRRVRRLRRNVRPQPHRPDEGHREEERPVTLTRWPLGHGGGQGPPRKDLPGLPHDRGSVSGHSLRGREPLHDLRALGRSASPRPPGRHDPGRRGRFRRARRERAGCPRPERDLWHGWGPGRHGRGERPVLRRHHTGAGRSSRRERRDRRSQRRRRRGWARGHAGHGLRPIQSQLPRRRRRGRRERRDIRRDDGRGRSRRRGRGRVHVRQGREARACGQRRWRERGRERPGRRRLLRPP
jgi:hypothetical protein